MIIPFIYYWPKDWYSRSRPASIQTPPSSTTPTSGPNPSTTTSEVALTPSRSSASRTLVVARLDREDVSWIQQELPDLQTAIYVVDDPSAEYHVPRNKGHEAMAYLTYIIDHYESLPEVTIYIHSDRFTWHNNDLLDSDLVKMIERLNSDRVIREGYFPLRCHLQPGCSDNLHLNRTDENAHKPEETVIRKVWSELHQVDPLPATLSAPCCGQFAVSRDSIRAFPHSQYLAWREWILQTDLDDVVSGRIWEYTWHYIFSSKADFCPDPHRCYCDGYGVCFESKAALDAWFTLDTTRKDAEDEYREWKEMPREDDSDVEEQNGIYEQDIHSMVTELDRLKEEAIARGDDPTNRRIALDS
ncbi:hypothetical protein MMC11_008560 [Xylographa trunciseda]|nr:hypothetical protein [Xylographa trunciseda]